MRIRLSGEVAVYHCTSRVVAGEMLLGSRAKEVFRRMLWQVAEFSGVEILAYCIMTNHIHVLVRVPPARDLDRREIMRRYRILYPEGAVTMMPDAAVMEKILADESSELAARWKERLLRRMHDVSEFMRTLKLRFSMWYNHTHKRFGTLWAERFRSSLVEDHPSALKVVAAYIDLNPVRAGLVKDPGEYRWSSYGEATGSQPAAQAGLASVVGQSDWSAAASDYRMVLFGKGAQGRAGEQGAIPQEYAMKVLAANGRLPAHELLRFRLRYMVDGAILGSEAFVRRAAQAALAADRRTSKPHTLGKLPLAGDSVLATWRRLQVRPVG